MSKGEDERIARERLERFGDSLGHGRVYAAVPVSGPDFGWSSASPVHKVDAVWVDGQGRGEVVDWSRGVAPEFREAVSQGTAVLVSPRGYADRTAFGMLVACRELFSRAYPDHGLLQAVALSEKISRRSIAYLAEGIDVLLPDGAAPLPAGSRGPLLRGEPEQPSAEDALLLRYYEDACAKQGTLWQEVPVLDAALDGLYLARRQGGLCWWKDADHRGDDDLAGALSEYDAEVIEVKRRMNMDVVGQVIAGAIALGHVYPEHRLVRQAVVVGGRVDPCLDWVCHKRGIRVARYT